MGVDPEKPIRDQSFKVAKGFMDTLEQVSENPELKQEMEAEVASTNSSQVISAASGWASWAVGAIGAKFYKSATPPPGSSQQVQCTPNPNSTSKDTDKLPQNTKPAGPNSDRDKSSPSANNAVGSAS